MHIKRRTSVSSVAQQLHNLTPFVSKYPRATSSLLKMTTYTIENQENQVDRAYLIDNQYNLAVAKSIVTGGTTVCNTIYQGSIIGPNMTVSWQEVYGVNFVLDIPTPGAKVTVKGIWQPLGLGEGYKLDNGGGWVANSGDKSNQPGFLNVLNEYDPHVHIVVGTQSQSTGEWSPVSRCYGVGVSYIGTRAKSVIDLLQ